MQQIKEKLVTVLEGGSALTSLLAAADAIYYLYPPDARQFPCLTYAVTFPPDPAYHDLAFRSGLLSIAIWATSGDVADDIREALAALLHDKQLTSANWKLILRWTGEELPVVLGEETDDGRSIELRRVSFSIEARQIGG